ncbi:uncharacterized protein N7498_007869 [Penicillium cinerascens]|uniref:Uncharacterized protein n=1 Tax=Penicillium cinerascens TaxID=70096 RepID=A0A9W9JLR8_9EURO|nr:uncharacterized protein N7498_007869 [Penicillium cinerascens]KAJ5198752.1 hypothetical protein N7498_007869 [Penicillium cinerascens]
MSAGFASSSVYSRSTGSVKIHGLPVPDCLHVRAADHHVGDARGLSTALETTVSRLQIANKDRPRACSGLYEELALTVTEASRKLLSQTQSHLQDCLFEQESETTDRGFLLQGAKKINAALQNSRACETAALQNWIDKWDQAPGAQTSVRWVLVEIGGPLEKAEELFYSGS